jgi:hypothetical protein
MEENNGPKREIGPDALDEGILAGYIAVICAGAALIMLLAHLLPEVRLYIPLILSLVYYFSHLWNLQLF